MDRTASLDAVDSVWRAAEQVAASFSKRPDISGVVLFGSVARRRSGTESDIDLLVVGNNSSLTSRALVAALPARLRLHRLALKYFTERELGRLFDTGPAFTEHLRREGVILYDRDGSVRKVIRSPARRAMSLDDEIALNVDRLRPLEDWRQYNGNFLACLAQLYVIAKAVVILVLLKSDVVEFDHRAIFDTYRARYPDRSEDLDTVAELAHFSRLLAGVRNELPYSYRNAESDASAAVAAIRRLAAP